jgi:hypothetical protein
MKKNHHCRTKRLTNAQEVIKFARKPVFIIFFNWMEPPMETSGLSVILRLLGSSARHFSLCLLLVMWACLASFGQKDTGAIAGTVKDASGAVVAGAKVTITDADRGTSNTSTTNAQGEYVFSPLRIGRYNVTIEKQGFKKAVAGPITVDVQERPRCKLAASMRL